MKIHDFDGPKPSETIKIEPKSVKKQTRLKQDSGKDANNEERQPKVRSKTVLKVSRSSKSAVGDIDSASFKGVSRGVVFP